MAGVIEEEVGKQIPVRAEVSSLQFYLLCQLLDVQQFMITFLQ